MTPAAFERLIYTDCRAGHGRGGGDGFQIQAQSPGVTAGLARLAVNSLLYVAPTEWLADRAVEDFPLGLAHAVGDGWGTAQSRYLGKEVTGSRSGNHLADCLLTTDTEPYGFLRPAQLYDAALWRAVPFETTECSPYEDFLEPGPLTSDAIQGWLREDPDRPAVLARLLTVLEETKGKKVAIVATATEEAVRWIAAATVLLPIASALDLSFKVFVTDVDRSSQRVVAVHKELEPGITPRTPGSRFVIDATTGLDSGGEMSVRAAYWVGRLRDADDAYDVVEAVDFAYALGDGAPVDIPGARETAWLVSSGEGTPADLEPIVSWLLQPKDQALGEHETAAATRLIASGRLDRRTLAWMERQADRDRLYLDRVELRQALLTVEIAEAMSAPVDFSEELAPVDIGHGSRRDAESALTSALLLTGDDETVERLLRVARRHDLTLAVDPLRDRLGEFVANWIADPGRDHDPGAWALSDFIVAELARQLGDDDPVPGRAVPDLARSRPLLEVAWPYLVRCRIGPDRPLAWELRAAAVANAGDGSRKRELERAVVRLADAPDPVVALGGFQDALERWHALSRADAMSFVCMVPAGVPLTRDIADDAFAEIRARAGRPDLEVLDALRCLDERHLLPRHDVTDKLAAADRGVAAFANVARRLRSVEGLRDFRALAEVDPRVLRLRAPDLVDLCLEDGALPLLGAAVLAGLRREPAEAFVEAWEAELGRADGRIAAARGYLWSETDAVKVPDGYRRGLVDGLDAHAATLDDERKAAWVSRVEMLLGPDGSEFRAFLEGKHRRRHLGRLRRG